MITTVLFDLDGTLLPMDMDVFTRAYFKLLAKKAAPYGYEPESLIQAVWKGTGAMVKNDGSVTNEEAFWKCFTSIYGEKSIEHKAVFDEFYRVEFQQVKDSCGFNPKAREAVEAIKALGLRTVLATNPLFPAVATKTRIGWAGFSPEEFAYYTTYENSTHCKPNLAYYEDVLQKIGCKPEECLMVGNDVNEDMVAENLGMAVFLLSDCLLNKDGKDISCYPQGGFEDLVEYVKKKVTEE